MPNLVKSRLCYLSTGVASDMAKKTTILAVMQMLMMMTAAALPVLFGNTFEEVSCTSLCLGPRIKFAIFPISRSCPWVASSLEKHEGQVDSSFSPL